MSIVWTFKYALIYLRDMYYYIALMDMMQVHAFLARGFEWKVLFCLFPPGSVMLCLFRSNIDVLFSESFLYWFFGRSSPWWNQQGLLWRWLIICNILGMILYLKVRSFNKFWLFICRKSCLMICCYVVHLLSYFGS